MGNIRSILTGIGILGLMVPVPARAQSIPIKVTLLGTGSPTPAMDRFGPATLVEAGGQRLLFDAGRGASQRLWQLKIPLGSIDALFLTHFHSDHTVGIPDLWLTGWLSTPFGRRTASLEVWGPAGTRDMMSGLANAYQWDVRIRSQAEQLPAAGGRLVAHDIAEGVIYDRDGVKVTAFVVDHGEELKPAFGYRVDHAGHSVVISGDTRPSENLVRHAAGADVLVHEVAAVRPELLEQSSSAPIARRILGWHTSPEDAGRLFARVAPKLAVFTHVVLLSTDAAFPPPTAADVIRRARTTWNGPTVLGEDLMTIEIGDSVAVRRFDAGGGATSSSASPRPPADPLPARTASALAIGETFTLASTALGETRRINVYLPPIYSISDSVRLPVLYMPDGGIGEDFFHIAGLVQVSVGNGTMRPFVLVGIENTQRRRDMTGPTDVAEDRKIAPVVGGSAAFRTFIRTELMPAVNARYRTTDETAIMGESLAGLFVVESFFLEPALFDAYIAFDPSLWWNGGALVKVAAERLGAGASDQRALYLASSSEPAIAKLTAQLVSVLESAGPAGLTWHYEPMPNETHATIYHPAALRALRQLFKPARADH